MTKGLFVRSGNYFLGMIASKAINLFLFIAIAKLLLPAEFGSLVYFTTILTLTTVLADFGISQWYQKHVSSLNNKTKTVQAMLSARALTLLVSILAVGSYLVVSQRFSLVSSALLIATLLPDALLSIFDGYYLEKKQPFLISQKQILKSVILVVCVAAFYSQLTLEIFAGAMFVSSILNMIWFVPWKYFSKFAINLRVGLASLKQSASYAVLITTSYAYSRGDSIIIENSIGSAGLGIYSAAYRYLEGLSLLPNALAQNLFHIAAKKDSIQLRQLMSITGVMFGLGLVAGLCVFLFSSFLTSTLLGVEYAAAEVVLKIFSLVTVLFFVNAPLSSIVQSSDHLKRFVPWGLCNTILNLILNIVFIPKFGVTAAAWIMLATEFTGLLINGAFVRIIYKK